MKLLCSHGLYSTCRCSLFFTKAIEYSALYWVTWHLSHWAYVFRKIDPLLSLRNQKFLHFFGISRTMWITKLLGVEALHRLHSEQFTCQRSTSQLVKTVVHCPLWLLRELSKNLRKNHKSVRTPVTSACRLFGATGKQVKNLLSHGGIGMLFFAASQTSVWWQTFKRVLRVVQWHAGFKLCDLNNARKAQTGAKITKPKITLDRKIDKK